MKRTWFPRFLSLLLTFVMLFELLPANVWATDAEADPAYTEPFSQDPAPEAPQDAPLSVVGEVESLRTQAEKHYRLSDGSYIAVNYGMPVHYALGDGDDAAWVDIDNTLTADRSQELPDEVAGWLDTMRKAGVRLTIVSNGAEKRVRPFAQKLGLAYLYRSAKPLPFALMAAQHRMGVKHSQMAMVGDQLYADRMAAALYGIPGLMVIPRGPDLGAQVILKRKWEKKHWQKYYDRGGKTL